MILLDTHVVVWLYAGQLGRFSERAIAELENNELAISPVVELELAYLNEIDRITVQPESIIGDLAARIGLTVDQIGLGPLCAAATELSWTRDPFDRLQAAHALTAGLPLLTRDVTLRQHLALAVWD